MKTKKLATGWYKITTDKDVYEVENNIDNTLWGEEIKTHQGELK